MKISKEQKKLFNADELRTDKNVFTDIKIKYPDIKYEVRGIPDVSASDMMLQIYKTSYIDILKIEDYIRDWYKVYPDGMLAINNISIKPMNL